MTKSVLFLSANLNSDFARFSYGVSNIGVIGCTSWFFALYVGQIRIRCIFIARRYASMVYAIIMCPCGVDVAYQQLSDWTRLQWALHS